MSSATWTPAALSPERRRARGTCWRVVEAQHRVATMKLADTLEEQGRLEQLLEMTKPPVPAGCEDLHYLLSTPFRYGAPYPAGSRFRRAGFTQGVFYASEETSTAVAELAFHRLLFYADSPRTPWPSSAGEYTVFATAYRSAAALDLARAPLDRDAEEWSNPVDYAACQRLADAARAAGCELLRYRSVRAPGAGTNVALLTCRAFAERAPHARQTWRIHVGTHGVRALCAEPVARLGFGRTAFAADPRIAQLNWQRG